MPTPSLHLYLDDSGTRYLKVRAKAARDDGIDHFALGGLLIESERVGDAATAIQRLKADFDLDAPLHSNSIRVRKGAFAWLESDLSRADKFYARLSGLLCGIPSLVTACVVHRPGYRKRYEQMYGEDCWDLCKSAYPMVIERSAKFAALMGRRLLVYVEESGKKEDRAIKEYHRLMVDEGMYFNATNSGKYNPLTKGELSSLLSARPSFVKKGHLMMQLADLYLYPVVKGRYVCNYPPYLELRAASKFVDDVLSAERVPTMGVKYFCFDGM